MGFLNNIFIANRLIVLLSLYILNHHVIFTQSFSSPFVSVCSENSTFRSNSTYSSNLVNLLSELSTHGSESYKTKKGDAAAGELVYGSYFCRGDVSAAVCKDCVSSATRFAAAMCPLSKDVVMWYDECTLRYLNRSFFDAVEKRPMYYAWNTKNASEPIQFREGLERIMNESVKEVDNGDKLFLTKNGSVDGLQTIYWLMQCKPGISSADCRDCLGYAMAWLSNFSRLTIAGARVLSPSCNVRYELYPFYGSADPLPPPPPPPLPLPPPTPPPPPPPLTMSPPPEKDQGISKGAIAGIVSAAIFVPLAFGVCWVLLLHRWRLRLKKYDVVERENESLQFDLLTIEIATQNFCKDKKLGEGGFGEVYKGILPEGQEIAVKRLSKSSGQGALEFKNEVALVAKLQHRNLVRLLGFCLGGGETILVYEFVPNKSLDYFLFDAKKQGLLDWPIRCKIISGIARGILYLHEDSRLKVIHRDLKASNILLDGDMNPKIADFGMAKMVGVDQTEGNTKRIVGTYGYMSPEYAMEGLYSIKSDVFSFGVLILELLSGKKNSGFHLTKFAPSLLAYAWKLWKEGKCLDLMDECLENSFHPNEFVRYVHIGLLCVQEDAYNRPTMSFVVLMLTSETITLPIPERPAFSVGRFGNNNNHLQDLASGDEISANGLTMSTFGPR